MAATMWTDCERSEMLSALVHFCASTPTRAGRRGPPSASSALEDADLGIELVEQPTPAADLDGLAFVTTHVDTPILADESVWSARDAIEVVRRRAADLVNVKLTKCGGLAPALQIAAVAAATDVGVLVGSMMETHVGVGAAVALTAAIGTPHVCDLDAAWWLASPPVKGGITYGPGIVTLSSRPGLGVELA